MGGRARLLIGPPALPTGSGNPEPKLLCVAIFIASIGRRTREVRAFVSEAIGALESRIAGHHGRMVLRAQDCALWSVDQREAATISASTTHVRAAALLPSLAVDE